MTLYHMLFLSVLVASSTAGAFIFAHRGGSPVVGFAVGAALAVIAALLAFVSTLVFHVYRPPLPPCRTRRCTYRHYRFGALTPRGLELTCRCGDRYLKHQESGLERFDLIADGEPVPYQERRKRGPWIPLAPDAKRGDPP